MTKGGFWNPWHGCHKCSPGCLNCYVYYLDAKRNIDASNVRKVKANFNLPIKKNRKGEYKVKSGVDLATCFTSDFFLAEADEWRDEAWEIIRQRPDVNFLICTKRIERFNDCIPADWEEGYDNVIIAVTVENQEKVKERLPIFLESKIRHRYIFASPLLEEIDLLPYLSSEKIEMVSVGGESYDKARVCDFDWVKKIRNDCLSKGVKFDYHQTGSNFLKDGVSYKIKHHDEYSQAKKAMELMNEKRL